MLVVTELPGEHAAGDRDRDIGSLAPDLGQGLVASRRDFALGPVTGGLGLGPGQLDDLLAAGLGLLLGLIEDGLDPFVGLGHQPAMLGEELLALVADLLGLEKRMFEMLLALVQGLGERLPGIPPQHPKEAEKDHYRPDGQGGLRFHRIGLAFTLGGMARSSSLMANFRLGLELVVMRGRLCRSLGMARQRRQHQYEDGEQKPDAQYQDRTPQHALIVAEVSALKNVTSRKSLARPGSTRKASRDSNLEQSARAIAGPKWDRRSDAASSTSEENLKQDDDQREERHAFDKRGRDDHRRLDVAGDLGLASHAVDRALGQVADSQGRAHDHQAGADSLEIGERRMHRRGGLRRGGLGLGVSRTVSEEQHPERQDGRLENFHRTLDSWLKRERGEHMGLHDAPRQQKTKPPWPRLRRCSICPRGRLASARYD